MINVGEQIAASYLQFIRACEFIQQNLYTVEVQGEIDVVGINLKERRVYICEVAVHLVTGLQYTKDKRPNNVEKLTEKFSRDIQYANAYFPEYAKTYMLWSPIVKDRGASAYSQTRHLEEIDARIRAQHGVEIDFIVNSRFAACLAEMRDFARKQTADIKCPILRYLQIEELLGKHLEKLA